jgi:hypothetical protein
MTAAELDSYYEGKTLPTGPIQLNHYGTILDPSIFVESQFTMFRANPGHRENDSCLLRLIEFKEWLDSHTTTSYIIGET